MIKYAQMLDAYRLRETHLKYSPLHLYIEPTNVCNLSCSHCAHKVMLRDQGFIDLELFKKAVEECTSLGIEWIYLFHIGEPLLHFQLKKMIDFIHSEGRKIRLHTNGTFDLADLEVDALFISANETEFSGVKPNIDNLIRNEKPFKISILGGTSKIPPSYSEYTVVKDFHSWQGLLTNKKREDILCSHPYKAMVLLWDGQVVPCCADYDASHVIGDFKAQTLWEIWNSEEMQVIRSAPLPMCEYCTVLRKPAEEVL